MVVDFHTHILPGIDDGSCSVSESLEMLYLEASHGVTDVVLTPHFYARRESPDRFLVRRKLALEQLQAALSGVPSLPQLWVGAEVYYFEGISDCEQLRDLTIQGTNYIMIEMPSVAWTDRMLRELEGISRKHRLIPVLAHVDRYVNWFSAKPLFARLDSLPVAVQVNSSFFLDRSTRNIALKLLRQGKIQFLGSDCHNLKDRAPDMDAALKILQKHHCENFLEQMSAR